MIKTTKNKQTTNSSVIKFINGLKNRPIKLPAIEPTIKTNKKSNDLAYFAGICEGEASLFCSKSRSKSGNFRYGIGLKLAMNDRAPVEQFARLFGGKVYIGSKKQNIKTKTFYSPSYCVSFSSLDKVEFILKSLSPFFRFKGEQSQTLLDFIRLKRSFKELAAPSRFIQQGLLNNIYLKSKNLKQKGWIIPK